jgi:hypothetical protein
MIGHVKQQDTRRWIRQVKWPQRRYPKGRFAKNTSVTGIGLYNHPTSRQKVEEIPIVILAAYRDSCPRCGIHGILKTMHKDRISEGFLKSHPAGWFCAELTTASHYPNMD